MAYAVELSSLSKKHRDFIQKTYIAYPNKTDYDPEPGKRKCYAVRRKEGIVYLPLGSWKHFFDEFPNGTIDDYPRTKVKFDKFELLTKDSDPSGKKRDQDIVAERASRDLEKYQCAFLALCTGYGKTSIGTWFTAWSKLKTVVLCYSIVVRDQWVSEYAKFTNAKVNMATRAFDPEADVNIIGVIKACKFPRETYDDVGLVIIDEAHLVPERTFTKTLLRFRPYYMIALTATPKRDDGLHRLFTPYFGPRSRMIVRKEVKAFKVIRYTTSYVPTIKKEWNHRTKRMTIVWSEVERSISEMQDRWREIAQIAIDHPNRKWIILSNRQVQSRGIYHYLIEKGESAELLIGTKRKWDRTKRILVAGIKKAGVGLNDPKINGMIIASSVKNVEQMEGRARPVGVLLYDIVDNYSSFDTHWKLRKKWYLSRGATIELGGTRRPLSTPSKVKAKEDGGERRRFSRPRKVEDKKD